MARLLATPRPAGPKTVTGEQGGIARLFARTASDTPKGPEGGGRWGSWEVPSAAPSSDGRRILPTGALLAVARRQKVRPRPAAPGSWHPLFDPIPTANASLSLSEPL